ncbi:MAG: LamG domain-containing protein [Phycisphaerae bacterium]
MARQFDNAQDQYVDCGSSTLLSPDAQPFTLGCWARRTGSPADSRQVVTRVGATARINLRLTGAYAPVFRCKSDAGVNAQLTATETLAQDTWHSLCCVRETSPTGQLRLYLDGVEVTNSPLSFGASETISSFSNPLLIGRNPLNTARDWDGDVAMAFLYKGVAATPGQAAGLARGLAPWLVLGSGLTACWPLRGTASPEPEVMSGLNGTLVNGPGYAADPIALSALAAGSRRRRIA